MWDSKNSLTLTISDIKINEIDEGKLVQRRNSEYLKTASRKWSIANISADVNFIPEDKESIDQIGDDNKNVVKKTNFCKRYMGILFGISASGIFSLSGIIVKTLTLHPLNLGVVRFLGLLLPSLALIPVHFFTVKNSNVLNGVWPWSWKTVSLLIMRSFTGCCAVVLVFYSLSFLSLADTSVISFSTPIIIVFLAYFILKEPLSIVQLLMAVFSLVGVFIIARPPFLTGADSFDTKTLTGSGLAFGSMILTALVLILLRSLKNTHYLLITFVFGVWGTVQCFVIGACLGVLELPVGLKEWILVAALAILTFFGQTLLTLALKYESSNIVALLRCLDVIFSFMYEFIFFGVIPDIFSIVGATIVISAVIIIGVRKFIIELPDESSTRIKLKWLLY